jgi:diguanylate cyclase (GGDEF)-like protein
LSDAATITAQDRLVRYDAALELFAILRRQSGVLDMARAAASRWKFCANVSSWRLIHFEDPGFIVIDGDRESAWVHKVGEDGLDPADADHWRAMLPRKYDRAEIDRIAKGFSPHLTRPDVAQLFVLPLSGREGAGKFLLIAGSHKQAFDKLDLKFLPIAAQMLAGEVQALHLNEKITQALRDLSLFDGLTQIPNRRSYDERAELEWKAAIRDKHALSLLMLDVDFFKVFNDTFGHQSGDACLKRVAQALHSAVRRARDFTARVGGEEFAVLLPDTTREGAQKVAGAINAAVAGLNIPHRVAGVDCYVTVSVGTATVVPRTDLTFSQLAAAADDALYEAKHNGRNRWISAPAFAPPSDVQPQPSSKRHSAGGAPAGLQPGSA